MADRHKETEFLSARLPAGFTAGLDRALEHYRTVHPTRAYRSRRDLVMRLLQAFIREWDPESDA